MTKLILSLFVIVILSGCEVKMDPASKSIDKTIVELAYIRGWQDGFSICSRINQGTITNQDQATAIAHNMKTNFLSTLK